jgi:hypothetical protein
MYVVPVGKSTVFGASTYPAGNAPEDAYRDPPEKALQVCAAPTDPDTYRYTRKSPVRCYVTLPGTTTLNDPSKVMLIEDEGMCKAFLAKTPGLKPAAVGQDKFTPYTYDTSARQWPVDEFSYSVGTCPVIGAVGPFQISGSNPLEKSRTTNKKS